MTKGLLATLMRRATSALSRPALTLRTLRVGLVALNAIVMVLCGWTLALSWRMEIGDAETGAITAVRLLERAVSATLDKTSIALNGVAGQLERQLADHGVDEATLWPLVDAATAQLSEVDRIGVFDAAGHQMCGLPLDRCRHIDISDRDYFAQLREHPSSTTTLYGPYLGRPTNEPSVIMVRSMKTPQQAFAGVVLAIIPLARFQDLVSAAQFGPHGAASLRMTSMQVLARASGQPNHPDPMAGSVVSERLRLELSRFPEAGVYRAVAARDGVERVAAYRKLPGYPLYAMVGEATEDFLVGWWGMVTRTGAFLLLILVASLVIERVVRTSLVQQARAQRLYDHAPCGYHTLDAQGLYLSINATELQWLGCEREEVIGKLAPADFFTAEGQATFATHFPELKSTGRLDELALDLVGRQGQVRRVLVSAKAVTDHQGHFVLSNSVMHDISELHRVQEQARATARIQSLMLDTEMVGLARLKARHVVWANHGMSRIFGYSGAEWHGLSARRFYVDDDAYEQVGDIAYAQLRAGELFRTELQMRRKDGSLCWMDIGVAPLSPEEDEVMLLVVDISTHKAAEAARLREVELRAQNEQLMETGRIKDEFLSNMSHELRTPLNAVIGFSQLLQSSKFAADSPKHESYIRQISDSGQHLLTLLQTMLDFAKSASDRMAFNPETLVVRQVIHEVVDLLEGKARAAQVDIKVAVDPGLETVISDPLRLRQMVLNLVENAVKFSKPGGVVNVRGLPIDAMQWRLDVEDQGIGIGDADLQRLFDPFIQLSAGLRKTHGGTGMGLALVRKIARAQGGDISVRSQTGVGSVFALQLPRVLTAWPLAVSTSNA